MWSILALVIAAVGTAATLGAGRFWVLRWAGSGVQFRIGQWHRIEIPDAATNSLVYYQSPVSVSQFMRLSMRDAYGERSGVRTPTDDNEFSIGDVQGRALFRLNLPEPGVYDIRCDNPNYASDAEVPADDRVVFLKSPNTRTEMMAVRRFILATGGTVTFTGTVCLYLLHGLTLIRRGSDGG